MFGDAFCHRGKGRKKRGWLLFIYDQMEVCEVVLENLISEEQRG